MKLRERLRAGLRLVDATWARDLARLYGLGAGESLVVAVRRPAQGGDLEVQVQAPVRPARRGRPA